MERVLNQLLEKLSKALGERLISVILYGSAASGEFHEDFSDLNILCVLTRIAPRELADSEPIFRWWRELGNPAPLLLSEHEVAQSTDCFPIEFCDIRERRRVLHGRDVIEGLEIDRTFYRAQVEHELRAKLLRLRQKAAGVLSDNSLLLRLLTDSVSTFCMLARHALLLEGETAEFSNRSIVERAQSRFGMDASAFGMLLDLREHKRKPKEVEPVTLFGSYLEAIGRLVEAVDKLEK